MLVDAIHLKAVEFKQHPHPFRVTLGQIIVDRHHVDALAGQGVEIDRQRLHERLTFTRAHLGDFALMQHDAADELHVVVHHVPPDEVAARHPPVLVVSLAVADVHIVARGRQVAVPRHGRHLHLLVLGKTARRLLDHGEGFRQNLVQNGLRRLVNLLLDFVDFGVEAFFFLHLQRVLAVGNPLLERGDRILFRLNLILNPLAELGRLGAQAVVVKRLDRLVGLETSRQHRLNLLQVPLRLIAENLLEYTEHNA